MAENIIMGNMLGMPSPRPDWNQTNPLRADFIKNKPDAFKTITYDYEEYANTLDDLKEYGVYKLICSMGGLTSYLFFMQGDLPEKDKMQLLICPIEGIKQRYWDMTKYNGDDVEPGRWSEWESVNSDVFAKKEEVADIKNGVISFEGHLTDLNVHLTETEKDNVVNLPTKFKEIDSTLTLVKGTVNAHDTQIMELYGYPEFMVPTVLKINTAYNFGEQTELSLSFPMYPLDGEVIYISFTSGETATNLTVDTTNTSDIDLIPEPNTGYEIYAKYNGSIWIVKYSEYTVSGV